MGMGRRTKAAQARRPAGITQLSVLSGVKAQSRRGHPSVLSPTAQL